MNTLVMLFTVYEILFIIKISIDLRENFSSSDISALIDFSRKSAKNVKAFLHDTIRSEI